jgi:hypothetical protein
MAACSGRFFMNGISHHVVFCVGFCHSVSCFGGSSTWHVSVFQSFSWLSNTLVHRSVEFWLSLHLLVDMWVASVLWLLCTMLL